MIADVHDRLATASLQNEDLAGLHVVQRGGDAQSSDSAANIIIDHNNPTNILPTHRFSRLPLIVLPIQPRWSNANTWEDYDHGNYPKSRKELQGIGGQAVRCSFGQDLPRWLHERKHNLFPHGPAVPHTLAEKYTACILACADFIPRHALDLSKDGSFEVVEMSNNQVADLAGSRAIHLEDAHHANGGTFYRNVIGKFIAYYAAGQDLSHVSEATVDEFLHTGSAVRKRELGNLLLAESVDVSVEPVMQLRRDFEGMGLVQLRRRELHSTPRRFFLKSRFIDYHEVLEKNLRKSRGLTVDQADGHSAGHSAA